MSRTAGIFFGAKPKQGQNAVTALTLKKLTAISQQPAWFEPYYATGSEKQRDRMLFSC